VDGEDRVDAVLGRFPARESAVRIERRADDLGPLGDLVGRDEDAHVRLVDDVMAEVSRAVDDLHR
jgi:hypothetical protein